MNLKKYLTLFAAIGILFFMPSCGLLVKSMGVSNLTVEKKAIPPDFGKEKTTLLCVISGRKSYDKHLKKHVIKEYHGDYEFVLRYKINSEKYKDTTKYRYVFDVLDSYGAKKFYSQSSNSVVTTSESSFSFYVLDRKEDKIYNATVTSSFYARLMQAYMINLEKERLKYQ